MAEQFNATIVNYRGSGIYVGSHVNMMLLVYATLNKGNEQMTYHLGFYSSLAEAQFQNPPLPSLASPLVPGQLRGKSCITIDALVAANLNARRMFRISNDIFLSSGAGF
ncbi:hypothetical protein CRG98_009044 [Punica granatum]|uniref:Uncharacterized protein n=1 Tax=Punica granatum TaxID=22663 RepID=A0A2I0KQ27_PUNGR|nr:hypothetical protein CRG98_009044 [Punica granatum]